MTHTEHVTPEQYLAAHELIALAWSDGYMIQQMAAYIVCPRLVVML